MRDKRRVMEIFSFYDRSGLERRLAAMAEKGWLLEKIIREDVTAAAPLSLRFTNHPCRYKLLQQVIQCS